MSIASISILFSFSLFYFYFSAFFYFFLLLFRHPLAIVQIYFVLFRLFQGDDSSENAMLSMLL